MLKACTNTHWLLMLLSPEANGIAAKKQNIFFLKKTDFGIVNYYFVAYQTAILN